MTAAEIFNGLAEVYEAGARKSRQWTLNANRQQEAEVFQAMADKAREIAARSAE